MLYFLLTSGMASICSILLATLSTLISEARAGEILMGLGVGATLGTLFSCISVEIVVIIIWLLVFAPLLIALLVLPLVALPCTARTGILPGSVGVGS